MISALLQDLVHLQPRSVLRAISSPAHVSPVARQQRAHLIKKRLSGDATAPESSCGMAVQPRANLLTEWLCTAASIVSPAEPDESFCL